MSHPWVLAITGASGAIYGVRLLQQMVLAGCRIHLVISESGAMVLKQELGIDWNISERSLESLCSFPTDEHRAHWGGMDANDPDRWRNQIVVHDPRDFMTPIASGSFRTEGMVVCPCSGSTLAGIVHAHGKDLIQRAAEVHLKEHRRLVLVPRETPLSVFQIENLMRAANAGAVVLPASPGWYHGVHSLIDLVDFIVARILDHLKIEHRLMRRWGEGSGGTQ